MYCTCCIIPKDVLEKLSHDNQLPADSRKASADTAKLSDEIRKLRRQNVKLTGLAASLASVTNELAPAPAVTVYDCKNLQTLPGSPVPNPGGAADATAKRAFNQTTKVGQFYKQAFGRNSIDNAGMTLLSSVHFGSRYNNALWNGQQMIYGDGDGSIFVDFTNGNDVIGHELTHGVTQYTLRLNYTNDAGGLNESLSDCFGSMFRQWEAGQDVKAADWLIGAEIMGPAAKTKGYTCLRDMANPAAQHCLAPQPAKYSDITPGMDPHYSSGPPNLAFCTACKTLGGKSWEKIGKVWYAAMTQQPSSPNMKMKDFASRTRRLAGTLFGGEPAVGGAVDKGWKQIGL